MIYFSDLKSRDLIQGRPLICPSCSSYMTFKERLKNGKGTDGAYKRRRFICTICDHSEIIHADGNRDVILYREEKIKVEKHMKSKEFKTYSE